LAQLITLDSSVIIAALRRQEEHYVAGRGLLESVYGGDYMAIEPYTVFVEVAAAIKRRTGSEKLSEKAARDFESADTISFFNLDSTRARLASGVAQKFSVRGMDASVIQIAKEFSTPLISLDVEILEKVKTFVKCKNPAEFKLAEDNN
jgi:predicted nucleic acid-binding protein